MSHILLGSLQSKQGHLEMPNECRRHVDQVMLPTWKLSKKKKNKQGWCADCKHYIYLNHSVCTQTL